MTRVTFAQALLDGPLLFDGAMGSLLYERGVLHTRSYDELNLSKPELVTQVHRDYVQAGANAIETNTFGANRIALAKHGLAGEVTAINRQGVELARAVAGDHAYVVGAVGPTGTKFAIANATDRKQARFALAEQIDALILAGVDALSLETFASILELETAIEVCRERGARTPVIAQLVFGQDGRGDGGLGALEVAERLIAAGADVIGANCNVGPAELYPVVTAMVGRGKPVIVQPNAGLPSHVEGRSLYVANAEHFGVFARRLLKSGVRILGGCCGTTPAHTTAMSGAVRMMGGLPPRVEAAPTRRVSIAPPTGALVPFAERSRLAARIASGQFVASVELTAPTGIDFAPVAEAAATLRKGGVDVVNIADGPRASARMSNLAVCSKLVGLGTEPILHVCARDRSFLGLVAHLLGAAGLGIRNTVIVTGDPPKLGDYPFSTPVYDVDSIGLLKIAAGLNAGVDPAGKQLGGHTQFLLATGAEPGAHDYERELRRLEEKKAAGAEVVMTQPVYDPRTMERFLTDTRSLGLPMLVGILPLASHRNAEFLHNEVPGMSIPVEYRRRMAEAGAGPSGRAAGIKIAQEALAAVRDQVAGVYIMPPFNRVESALAVLDAARPRWQPSP